MLKWCWWWKDFIVYSLYLSISATSNINQIIQRRPSWVVWGRFRLTSVSWGDLWSRGHILVNSWKLAQRRGHRSILATGTIKAECVDVEVREAKVSQDLVKPTLCVFRILTFRERKQRKQQWNLKGICALAIPLIAFWSCHICHKFELSLDLTNLSKDPHP